MISLLLSAIFYKSPKVTLSDNEIAYYEDVLRGISKTQPLALHPPYSKFRFLHYIALTDKYLFHGSNIRNIDSFEPREQTLFDGKLTTAIFATSDPIWPIFYGVLHRDKVSGNFRNGCLLYGKNRYHYYSLTEATLNSNPWISGMVYILPKDRFYRPSKGLVQPDEWICHEPIEPIGKLIVKPDDFYFIDKVAVHDEHESMLKTLFSYKTRAKKL